MIKALIFGGTTEGRELCEVCAGGAVPALYCVATRDGARQVSGLEHLRVHTGRLDAEEMEALITRERPAVVIDATHPYAAQASENIESACRAAGARLVSVERESGEGDGCIYFSGMDEAVSWLLREPGVIFAATGASCAEALTALPDYRSRVWLRILPSVESLGSCLRLGYRPERIICMQGPFTQELNRAMLKAAGAAVLLTKNSGSAGGFLEKALAAKSLRIKTAVLSRPRVQGGVSPGEAARIIMELKR